jgi:hypothetical protein
VTDLPEPGEWTDENWRDFLSSCWRSAHLLGTQVWTEVFYFVIGIILIVWFWRRRKQLLQYE